MEPQAKLALIGASAVLGLALVNRYANGGVNRHSPKQTGKVIVITGANTGLGFIAAEELARLGPSKLILACRDKARGQAAVDQIKAATKSDCAEFMQLDLNDLQSVKDFSVSFRAKYDKLDTLMMNAGVMTIPEREITKQGHEKQFGVNHIGHFLLAKSLLDRVKQSEEGRIVVLSSLAHAGGNKSIRFDDMTHDKSYSPFDAYYMSKLSNVFFTKVLAK